MEEQIKKLQKELELVKKERDSLILEKNKTFIKTRLKDILYNYTNADVNKTFIKSELKDILYYYTSADVKKEIPNQNYISTMYRTYETEIIQKLFNDYGYDLVLESFYDLCFEGERK